MKKPIEKIYDNHMVELMCAQLTGYKYGMDGHILSLFSAAAVTKDEWIENRDEYKQHMTQKDYDFIDEYFSNT